MSDYTYMFLVLLVFIIGLPISPPHPAGLPQSSQSSIIEIEG